MELGQVERGPSFEINMVIKGDSSGKITNLSELLSQYGPEVLYAFGKALMGSAKYDVEQAQSENFMDGTYYDIRSIKEEANLISTWPTCHHGLCTIPARPNKLYCSMHKELEL